MRTTPFSRYATIFPTHSAALFSATIFKEESLYEVLMNNPLSRIALTRTIISTERSTSEDMRLLGIKKDVPILVFSNTATSADGTVVDYAFTRHRGDLSSFEIEASPE